MIDDPQRMVDERRAEVSGSDRTTLILSAVVAAVFLAGLLMVFSTNDQRSMPNVAQTPRTEAPAPATPSAPDKPAPVIPDGQK